VSRRNCKIDFELYIYIKHYEKTYLDSFNTSSGGHHGCRKENPRRLLFPRRRKLFRRDNHQGQYRDYCRDDREKDGRHALACGTRERIPEEIRRLHQCGKEGTCTGRASGHQAGECEPRRLRRDLRRLPGVVGRDAHADVHFLREVQSERQDDSPVRDARRQRAFGRAAPQEGDRRERDGGTRHLRTRGPERTRKGSERSGQVGEVARRRTFPQNSTPARTGARLSATRKSSSSPEPPTWISTTTRTSSPSKSLANFSKRI